MSSTIKRFRALVRQPSFSVPAILTIGLGIGVTTAVFGLLYAVLLRPFPYGEPERLVRVFTVMERENQAERNCSLLDIEDYNRRATLIKEFGAYTTFDSQIEGDGNAQAVVVAQLNQTALRTLKVAPSLGRLFTPEEDRRGGPVHKAILSHGLWKGRYGGDPSIVGKTIRNPMTSFEVVGVMPEGFDFPDRADLWLPMESWYVLTSNGNRPQQRDQRWYATVARLQPGVSIEQAQIEMTGIAKQLSAEFPRDNEGVQIRLKPFRDAAVGNLRPYLWLLGGGVLLVMGIAAANVANLFLARVLAQQKQYVIQAALGASRWALARGLIADSLLVAMIGAIVGTGFAWAAVASFRLLLPSSVPSWIRMELDPAVLLFGGTMAFVVGCAVGVIPSLIGSRVNLEAALREGTRGSSGGAYMRSTLVVAEVSLSVLLLIGAGLLLKTFLSLQNADHGFIADNLVIARVSNSRFQNGDRQVRARQLAAYHSEIRDAFANRPGIKSVAVTNSLPYTGSETGRGRLRIEGRSEAESRFLLPVSGADVQPDFFEAMKIPLMKGRLFERTDSPDAPPVVIINETGAKALFPNQDPIGRMVQWGDTVGPSNPYCRIVGVVKDVRWEAAQQTNIQLYYPFTQWPVATAFYLFRSNLGTSEIASIVSTTLRESDDRAAVVWIKSMNDRINEALWQRRLWGVLFTVFAALAVLLAAVGLYGVLGYAVAQRRREIGIRMAIGSTPGAVWSLIVGDGLRLVVFGAGLGIVASVVGVRAMRSLVESETLTDWTVYSTVLLILAVSAFAACAIPAFRASRVDPLVALRDE